MECVSCAQDALEPELPLRERLRCTGGWRAAHPWSSLPGWLVVVARRRVESLAELPRLPWLGEDERATAAFRFPNVPDEEQVPVAERELLAAALASRLGSG